MPDKMKTTPKPAPKPASGQKTAQPAGKTMAPAKPGSTKR